MDCVLNFIALGIIAEIDNIYASSMQNPMLEELVDTANLPVADHGQEKSEESLTLWVRFLRAIHRAIKVFYVSYYFYFMAFTTVGVT